LYFSSIILVGTVCKLSVDQTETVSAEFGRAAGESDQMGPGEQGPEAATPGRSRIWRVQWCGGWQNQFEHSSMFLSDLNNLVGKICKLSAGQTRAGQNRDVD